MEKSKTEQYLERLQRWKDQKLKEKEERLKTNTSTSNTKSVSRLTVIKDATQEKKRKSVEARELSERLNKWREERRSEKKPIHQSGVKPKSAMAATEKPYKKEVKSRLFDYQTKQKSQTNQRDKENVQDGKKCLKGLKSVTHKQSCQKSDFKRRHSEVQKSQSKPVGILKRKSCIGSFDFTDEETGATVKRRRTSAATTDWAVKESANGRGKINEADIETDKTEAHLPTAVVTPTVSTRNVRFTTPPNGQTETRKLRKTPKTSAARRAELNDWLKAKGRTPSKFRHLMCFHGEHAEDLSKDPHTKNTLSVDDLSQQMDVLEQERLQAEAEGQMHAMLDECMILFEAGCPMESIVPWLDDIYLRIPCSQTSARFYTCKANVVKYSLDLDAVLEVFEQATINGAQPREQIAKCLTETVKYVTEEKIKHAKRRCPTPRREVQEENMFESSAVKYSVSVVTPLSERKRSSAKKLPGQSHCQVVTPVRRSTRRSLQNLPESLKDKKKSFSSLEDIEGGDVLFQPNKALHDVFDSMQDSS